MSNPFVSIIIPVRSINEYLRKETIPAILKQTYQQFEIIIIPDRKTKETFSKTKIFILNSGPAQKRDLAAKKAKGTILAFLDDDSYPDNNWLKNALSSFRKEKNIAAVGGPSLTPPHNNLKQKASGYVWSSWLGSGGAGTYRCSIGKSQLVDDFPTVNLLVTKKDFWAAGGFDCCYYPGEDTKLCLEITKHLKKEILYNPKVIVYHHRREIFKPHLKQVGRYAIHRGFFAKKFPETSFRIGYFMPSFFLMGILGGFLSITLLSFLNFPIILNLIKFIYFASLLIYLGLLINTSWDVFKIEKNISLSLMIFISIIFTHLTYGWLFMKGYLTKNLSS